jgi:hypothetical protein
LAEHLCGNYATRPESFLNDNPGLFQKLSNNFQDIMRSNLINFMAAKLQFHDLQCLSKYRKGSDGLKKFLVLVRPNPKIIITLTSRLSK